MRWDLASLLFVLVTGCPEPPADLVAAGQAPTVSSGGEGAADAQGSSEPGEGPGDVGTGAGEPIPDGEEGSVGDPIHDESSRIPAGMRIEPPGFGLEPGEGVKLSGTVSYPGELDGQLRVEILKEGDEEGAPSLLHAVNLEAIGPWSVVAPRKLGKVSIMAYIDYDQNGPDSYEPQGEVPGGVKVGKEDLSGLDIALEPVEGGASRIGLREEPEPAEGEAPAEEAEAEAAPAEELEAEPAPAE
jgi:hypothetical protein